MSAKTDLLVSISDIADLAGVSRPAVSNWRKRHAGFPAPRVQAPAGALFALDDVERWLIEEEKIEAPIPPGRIIRQLADAARGTMAPAEWSAFLTACLVYLEACKRATQDMGVSIPPHQRWDAIRGTESRRLHSQLIAAANTVEKTTPTLQGLLLTGLDHQPQPDPDRLRALLDTLEVAAQDELGGFVDVFETLVDHGDSAESVRSEHSTPDSIAQLLVKLAPPADTIIDLATGEGGLLLLAALHRQVGEQPSLIGYEINEAVHRAARSRFFLYDVPADLRLADVFRVPAGDLPKAELVVVDPPFGLSRWGDAEIYEGEQWQFGRPAPSSAEFAWAQLALWCLRPGGTAILVMPAGAAFRGARDAKIRTAMLDAGVIEAIIALPARVFTSTAIQPHLWMLRADRRPGEPVLMVNAADLGESTRSQTVFSQSDIDNIVEVVAAWRSHRTVEVAAPLFARAVERDEVVDGDLTPARYDTRPTVDLSVLRDRALELREVVSLRSSTALEALQSALEGEASPLAVRRSRRVGTTQPPKKERPRGA